MKRVVVVLAGVFRFARLLAVAVWLGGFAFFGAVAAPTLFRVARAELQPQVAPLMVGAMLERFAIITFGCAIVLIAAWFFQLLVERQRGVNQWAQGAAIGAATVVTLFLNLVLLPRTVAAQETYLPLFVRAERGEMLSPAEQAQRAEFDADHKLYNRLGGATVWMLLALLALFAAERRPERRF